MIFNTLTGFGTLLGLKQSGNWATSRYSYSMHTPLTGFETLSGKQE